MNITFGPMITPQPQPGASWRSPQYERSQTTALMPLNMSVPLWAPWSWRGGSTNVHPAPENRSCRWTTVHSADLPAPPHCFAFAFWATNERSKWDFLCFDAVLAERDELEKGWGLGLSDVCGTHTRALTLDGKEDHTMVWMGGAFWMITGRGLGMVHVFFSLVST